MSNRGWLGRFSEAFFLSELNIAALPITFALIASLIVPAKNAEDLPSLCIYYRLTGQRCPGCGMSRAFTLIGHGKLKRAYRLNRLAFIAYPLAVYVALRGWRDFLKSLASEDILNCNVSKLIHSDQLSPFPTSEGEK